ASEQDTFSEILPACGGISLRPQPVTNAIYTWQRSHVTVANDGQEKLTIRLTEGPGVYIDAVRIHKLTLNEPIKTLKSFPRDTALTQNGAPRCAIVVDDNEEYRPHAERLAEGLKKMVGTEIPIITGTKLTEVQIRLHHLFALGNRETNRALLLARPGGWGAFPGPPADGTPHVYVAVDTQGVGTNVVLLGGKDGSQVNASVTSLLEHLRPAPTPHLPWMALPSPRVDGPETYRKWAIESGKWLRQGGIRTILKHTKYYGDNTFMMFAHRYWEYLDSTDTVRRSSYNGALDMEFHKILPNFEAREHNGTFSDPEHLAMTNLMMRLTSMTQSLFIKWWGLRGPGGDEGVTQRIRERSPRITWNHQTFPALCLFRGADYFGRHYDLPQARTWKAWTEDVMRPALHTSKPICDCWGYQDITMQHTGYYAALIGRWDYFELNPLHDFLRLRLMLHDNLNAPVGNGDVGGYAGPVDGDPRNQLRGFKRVTGNRMDMRRVSVDDLTGLTVHPLERRWYDLFAKGSDTPPARAFDKLLLRNAATPDDAYLLLDGVSGGNHGHWDGNSILRFTDNGRMWLCEGDYIKGDAKDHNTATVMRNAESAFPQNIVELREAHATDEWAVTVTRTPDYQGLDWDRHIVWHRPTDTFIMLDQFTATKPGAYDATVRFRSLGETELSDRVWTVTQAGGKRFSIHAPGHGRLTEGSAPEDAKNWKKYPHAAPTPRLFTHRITRDLAEEDRMTVPNVFYAAETDAAPRLAASITAANAVLVKGTPAMAVFAGPTTTEQFQTDAANSVFSPSGCLLVGLTSLTAGNCALRTSQPVAANVNFGSQTVTITAASSGQLQLSCGTESTRVPFTKGTTSVAKPPTGLISILSTIQPALAGKPPLPPTAKAASRQATTHTLTEIMGIPLPAAGTCIIPVDLDGDGTSEWLAGTENGSLIAADTSGKVLWQHTFSGAVNALASADLDGDKRPEIACAVEDSHLHVLNADGTERWSKFFDAYRAAGGIEGHPRAVIARDFDGDGVPEIAVGCANSIFYVLNANGTPKTGGTGPWELTTQHKASAIDAAEMTGDGQLEMLCGFTYASRRIVDFSKSGYDRQSALSGCISGCMAITHADFDQDGRAEAVFADQDGKVTVCKPWQKKRLTTVVLWSRIIGDDAHVRALAANVSGDAHPELVLASRSGFLALVDSQGDVIWTRYAQDAVTDAAVLDGAGRPAAIARASRDGELALFAPDGAPMGSWKGTNPITKLAVVRTATTDYTAVLTKDRLHVLELAPR
ncbi:MAG: VCBS repeat-containing protein, partial [Lentisphaerae bacterium]|nr:VCBS repeat-containing protein [Lentisphaerota bacterium]